jgi:chromosome segregation ATPase
VAKGPFKQIKNMIQKMIFRLNKEQQDEDAHKNWCDQELETTEQQKDEKQDQVDEMQAKVESLTAKIEELREALEDAEKAIADTQQYMKDETDMRAENKAENAQTIADAKDAQAALAQAIGVLTQYYKESGSIAKESWEAMIQTGSMQAPALDYQGTFSNTDGSSAVMSLLETTLGDYSKMEAEAVAAEESESENFEQDMSENKVALAELRNEVKVKTARKTTLEEDKASTASLLKKGEKQLEALAQYLKDLDQPCVSGSSDYDTRKGARASEVTALKEALDVLAEAFKPKSFLAVH